MTGIPFVFNAGQAFFIDQSLAVNTPIQPQALQSISLDLKSTTKDVFGNNIFPLATGRSQIKVSGKAKVADYIGRMAANFIGASLTPGQLLIQQNEADSVPATSTYTITVTNSSHFQMDLGVRYASTGIPFVQVASGPTVGQYSQAAGVYTFAAADASASVLISYTYTSASAGDTISLTNTSAGAANTFKTVLGGSYNGQSTNLVLNACIYDSLKLFDTKIGDFAMPELDFSCIVDASGTLGTMSFPVAS